jgi:uncharacterized protein (TIGR03435 family)
MRRAAAVHRFALGLAAVAATASLTAGQASVPPLLSFEVASVKENSSEAQASGGVRPGGRFTVENWSLFRLISIAFQAYRDFEIVGAPTWTRTARFDINARAPAGIDLGALATTGPPTPAIQMLRSLLIDRFGITVHSETREVSAFALVVVRSDRLGPGLSRANVDCDAERIARRARGEPQPPSVTPTPGHVSRCAVVSRPGWLSAGSYPIALLVTHLADQLGRPVLDRTELQGFFDVDFSYTPDTSTQTNGTVAEGPALATALQEQLGLKLESTKTTANVVVIDSISRLTPD